MSISPQEFQFYIEEENEIGEGFYEHIKANIVVEETGWAFESVQQIAARLNQVRESNRELKPVVIWIPQPIAFIIPGHYLYISRELLQNIISPNAIAFLIAHEMAHHDLGHVRISEYSWIKNLSGEVHLGVWLQIIKNKFASLEHESQADKYGLDLCLAAGYDGERCLELFNILEANSLDFGDLDGVFGLEEPEETSDKLPFGLDKWLSLTSQWSQKLTQSHPTNIRSRTHFLQKYLNSL
jgi:Zn-dependent protease with chaperone function